MHFPKAKPLDIADPLARKLNEVFMIMSTVFGSCVTVARTRAFENPRLGLLL
jgi:hypothetical protein